MSRRRADRKLHLELLRARAAANRIELSLARQAISERLDPLRRAADRIGSVAGVLGRRGRGLRWLVAAGAALARARWARKALAGTAATVRSAAAPRMRVMALAALAAAGVALLIGRARRSDAGASRSRTGEGDQSLSEQ